MGPQPAIVAQAGPCKCQITDWLEVPRTPAVKDCVAPGARVALPGKTETTTWLSMVTCAVANLVGSAELAACSVTGFGAGKLPGARKSTCDAEALSTGTQGLDASTQTWPSDVEPAGTPLTDQFT